MSEVRRCHRYKKTNAHAPDLNAQRGIFLLAVIARTAFLERAAFAHTDRARRFNLAA
jgi:hypothetical protein